MIKQNICLITEDTDLKNLLTESSRLLPIDLIAVNSVKEALVAFENKTLDAVLVDPNLSNDENSNLNLFTVRKLKDQSKVAIVKNPLTQDQAKSILEKLISSASASPLQLLKIEFDKAVPGKLDEIEKLIESMRENIDLDNLKALKFKIHKMAGTAGSFGYMDVSILCKKFEQELIVLMDTFTTPKKDTALIAGFENVLKTLKNSFSQGSEKVA